MSILIKGMKKPTACYKCQLRTGKYCGILTENEKCADDGVLPHCPIVEIPPHGRLIDADETKRVFGDYFEKVGVARRYAKSLVDNVIPTVIESEQEHE